MKKSFSLLILCTFILCFSSIKAEANEESGTFILGMKFWYAGWDSSAIGDVKKDVYNGLDAGLKTALGDDTVTTQTGDNSAAFGNGWLTGPMIGYQTPGGKWSFSFAFMWWSNFAQKMETTYNSLVDPANPMPGLGNTNYTVPANIDIELKKREIDLAVSYSLTQYFKLFTGYKYSLIEVDVAGTIDIIHESNDLFDSQANVDVTVQLATHAFSIGGGYFYPILESLIISTQAGLLLGRGKSSSEDRVNLVESKSNWNTMFGFNTEINISKYFTRHFIFQIGFRYQPFHINGDWDHFFGGTMAVLTAF